MSARIVRPEDGLEEAAEILRGGGIVAFPTETVYGLGANALDAFAVAKIYAAKGRPASNPVIVHVPDVAAARALAAEWPESAERLAAQFWPGPLTLVVPKAAHIPDIVTAGGPTVGIRIPSHPVALELLRRAAVPVAAPSANRSEEVSPTTAQHVADSLGAFVDDLLILDGGPCQVGIESTVVDVTGAIPRVLRPGMVQIEEAEAGENSAIARSPGQMMRHYAPTSPLILCPPTDIDAIESQDGILMYTRPSVYPLETVCHGFLVLMSGATRSVYNFFLPPTPEEYGRGLYSALRALDNSGAKRILVQLPPYAPEWAAIHDRLRRAATKGVSE